MRSGADRPAISTGPALMIPAGYPRDLPSALLRAARDYGSAGVVEIGADGRETKLDFPTLLELAARILAGLRANGVRAGDPAVVHCTEPVGFFAAFWACTLGGIRPLLVAPHPAGDRTEEGRERLRKITDLLGWTVLIGRPSDLPNDLGLPVLDPDAMAGHEPTSDFHRPAADDVAVLMLSSGTTGAPKMVQLTHRGLVEFAAGTPAMLPVRPGQTTLNWLPLDRSGAFLLYHLLPVFTGCTNIHVNTDWVLANPLRWLDLMDQHRVNHSWSPNFGYRLTTQAIAGEPDRHWDLSALRSLVSGGEQITVPVMSEFLRVTNRFGVVPETFVAAWGMTETVTGITFARPGLTPNVHRVRIPPTGVVEWVDQRPSSGKVAVARPGKPRTEVPGVLSLVSVGAPAPGTTVRIVAPNGAVLPEGRIGQLQVASARVTPGYLGNLDADRAAFPVGNWPARKWLATGDQGFITGGQVVITGRDSERIILSGKLHYAHDIESVAVTVVGAEHGLVAACGVADEATGTDRLVVFYALTPDSVPGMDQAIRSLIQTRLGLPAEVIGVPRRDFPTTPGGKILRPLLKQRWIDGTLQPQTAPHVEPAGATSSSGPTGQGPSTTPETTPYADEDASERTTELPVVRLAWKRELQQSIPTPPQRPTLRTTPASPDPTPATSDPASTSPKPTPAAAKLTSAVTEDASDPVAPTPATSEPASAASESTPSAPAASEPASAASESTPSAPELAPSHAEPTPATSDPAPPAPESASAASESAPAVAPESASAVSEPAPSSEPTERSELAQSAESAALSDLTPPPQLAPPSEPTSRPELTRPSAPTPPSAPAPVAATAAPDSAIDPDSAVAPDYTAPETPTAPTAATPSPGHELTSRPPASATPITLAPAHQPAPTTDTSNQSAEAENDAAPTATADVPKPSPQTPDQSAQRVDDADTVELRRVPAHPESPQPTATTQPDEQYSAPSTNAELENDQASTTAKATPAAPADPTADLTADPTTATAAATAAEPTADATTDTTADASANTTADATNATADAKPDAKTDEARTAATDEGADGPTHASADTDSDVAAGAVAAASADATEVRAEGIADATADTDSDMAVGAVVAASADATEVPAEGTADATAGTPADASAEAVAEASTDGRADGTVGATADTDSDVAAGAVAAASTDVPADETADATAGTPPDAAAEAVAETSADVTDAHATGGADTADTQADVAADATEDASADTAADGTDVRAAGTDATTGTRADAAADTADDATADTTADVPADATDEAEADTAIGVSDTDADAAAEAAGDGTAAASIVAEDIASKSAASDEPVADGSEGSDDAACAEGSSGQADDRDAAASDAAAEDSASAQTSGSEETDSETETGDDAVSADDVPGDAGSPGSTDDIDEETPDGRDAETAGESAEDAAAVEKAAGDAASGDVTSDEVASGDEGAGIKALSAGGAEDVGADSAGDAGTDGAEDAGADGAGDAGTDGAEDACGDGAGSDFETAELPAISIPVKSSASGQDDLPGDEVELAGTAEAESALGVRDGAGSAGVGDVPVLSDGDSSETAEVESAQVVEDGAGSAGGVDDVAELAETQHVEESVVPADGTEADDAEADDAESAEDENAASAEVVGAAGAGAGGDAAGSVVERRARAEVVLAASVVDVFGDGDGSALVEGSADESGEESVAETAAGGLAVVGGAAVVAAAEDAAAGGQGGESAGAEQVAGVGRAAGHGVKAGQVANPGRVASGGRVVGPGRGEKGAARRAGVVVEPVAVVGVAGRFPGAETLEAFWDNLVGGVESVRRGVPEAGDGVVSVSGVLDHVESFDAKFFGLSDREAELMEPAQRLFLEVCHQALEHGGYAGTTSRVGVFAGSGMNLYNRQHQSRDSLATRVAYRLGLTGPAIGVQSAWSSSLVAVHLACQALRSGDADLALAGAAAVQVPQATSYHPSPGSILSPTGHVRAFAADADGTVGGNGVAAVLLKRLDQAMADGDTVYAVIRGTAVSNADAPAAHQADLIGRALERAGFDADSLSYIEANGIGSAAADAAEVKALTAALRKHTDKVGFCALGSVKSNIGHLDSAAGMAGLIKTILMLQHRMLVPTINYTEPNPALALDGSPFVINTEVRDWEAGTSLRAGVSALDAGGTIAHVILEEAPRQIRRGDDGPVVLPLSAPDPDALADLVELYRTDLGHGTGHRLIDLAGTAALGRPAHRHRIAVAGATESELVDALGTAQATEVPRGGPGPLGYAFTGQGAARRGMAAGLAARFPVFRSVLDECDRVYHEETGGSLLELLLTPAGGTEGVWPTETAQPALFAFELALARLWQSFGVQPALVVGHSVGEYAALCVAGALSLADGVRLTAKRGELMQRGTVPGAMVAVRADADRVREIARTAGVEVAAGNGPQSFVLTGSEVIVGQLAAQLDQLEVAWQRLDVDRAFHSSLVDPILSDFAEIVREITLKPLRTPMVSSWSGDLLESGTVLDSDYLVGQLRQPVLFGDAVEAVTAAGCRRFLELGPDAVLSPAGRRIAPNSTWIPAQRLGQDPVLATMNGLAELYEQGTEIAWAKVYADGGRVPLPTYPFRRVHHPVDPSVTVHTGPGTAMLAEPAQRSQPNPFERAARAQSLVFEPPSNAAVKRIPLDPPDTVAAEPVDDAVEEGERSPFALPAETHQIDADYLAQAGSLSGDAMSAERYRESLDVVLDMTCEVHNLDPYDLTVDHTFAELGATPASMAPVIDELNSRFEVELTPDDLFLSFTTPHKLATALAVQTAEPEQRTDAAADGVAEAEAAVEQVPVKQVPVEQVSKTQASKERASEEQASAEQASKEPASEEQASEERASEERGSAGPASAGQAADELVAGDLAAEEPREPDARAALAVLGTGLAELAAKVDEAAAATSEAELPGSGMAALMSQQLRVAGQLVDGVTKLMREQLALLTEPTEQPLDAPTGDDANPAGDEADLADDAAGSPRTDVANADALDDGVGGANAADLSSGADPAGVEAAQADGADVAGEDVEPVDGEVDLAGGDAKGADAGSGDVDPAGSRAGDDVEPVGGEADVVGGDVDSAGGEAGLGDAARRRGLAYWEGVLAGGEPLVLPMDRVRGAGDDDVASVKRELDEELGDAVFAYSRERKLSPVMTMLAAVATVLGRFAAQDDVTIGSALTRPKGDTSTDPRRPLPLRIDLSGEPDLGELTQRIRDLTTAAFEHAGTDLAVLQRDPLFQILVDFEDGDDELPATVDLRFRLTHHGAGITCTADYRPALFEQRTIERLLDYLAEVLRRATTRPNLRLPELVLPIESDLEALRDLEADAASTGPVGRVRRDAVVAGELSGLHTLFEQQVARTPDAVALIQGERELTYAELDRRSNAVAWQLVDLGVRPGQLVAVRVARGTEMVVAVLAVLKSGAAYLPLDPGVPESRWAFMVQDAAAVALVGDDAALADRLGLRLVPVAAVDGDARARQAPPVRAAADDIAYCIYTSGSTGNPKGVVVPHRGPVNLVRHYLRTRSSLRTLQWTSFGFDVHVQEMFTTLASGAALVLIGEDDRYDPDAVVAALRDHDVQRLFMAFSPLTALLATMRRLPELPALREIVAGGEAMVLTHKVREFLDAHPQCRLFNEYGPAEASIVTTIHEVDPAEDRPSIGRPIEGVVVRLLDAALRPVPVGAVGEIHLGGAAVAQGYLGRPDETEHAFVADPGHPGARLYRSRDLGRWRTDGTLEYLGRADDQVKIRGHRVEPGETEHVLADQPGVVDAVVVACSDPAGDTCLIGYVVLEDSDPAVLARLMLDLGKELPIYLVPADLIPIEELPLDDNGRLDRARLPEPEWLRP
ncbi:amino acid adenylation domain-containing protein [Kribbella sp. NPDC004875]|uniref:amino acid adenylation domain-containing protein n=1 Tax=Kribbella sp. NPDC004875 TaxID=3364107 RepID=UPI0036BC6D05